MSRLLPQALAHAAALIAAALGVEDVSMEPIGPEEGEAEPGEDARIIVALSEGSAPESIGFLMGAASPYEFQHDASLDILVVGGSAEDRRARRDAALVEAHDAIAADPTLGGLVDWAELSGAALSVTERAAHAGVDLSLTYSAPTALG